LAEAHEANARAHQAEAIGTRVVNQSKQNLYFETQSQLDELYTRGLTPKSVAEGINLRTKTGVFVGMNPKEVNSIVLQAVAQKAQDLNDTSVFDVLDHVKTGPG